MATISIPDQTIPSVTPEAYQFFLEHAGYATPPGREACAFELAYAEQYAKQCGWAYQWEDDPEPDLSWAIAEENGYEIETVEMVTLYDQGGKWLDSLCGITDATREYRRVVEAELAANAMGDALEYHTRQQVFEFTLSAEVQ